MPKEKKERKERKTKKTEGEAKSKSESEDTIHVSYNLEAVVEIAQPLASKDLTKKLLKTVRKAAAKKHIKRGVKEVVKGIRKGDKGLVIVAGDVSPIDVITHLPVLCEEAGVPYVYVPSKTDLGLTASTKRPTSVVMIIPGGKKNDDAAFLEYKKYYDACYAEAKKLGEDLMT